MGTAQVQGPLWSTRARDWAELQEGTFRDAYIALFDRLAIEATFDVLDVGCGAGLATRAAERSCNVTGFDAAAGLLAYARSAAPAIDYVDGDMEALPFAAASFDIVTGFNSFQYAENVVAALREAARVVRSGGRVATAVWGKVEDCDIAVTLKAVAGCMPPPPPGAPGPFALSGEGLIEKMMGEAGLQPLESGVMEASSRYVDSDEAWRGISASGPVIRAIALASEERVKAAATASFAPYVTPSGAVEQRNAFRYVIANKR